MNNTIHYAILGDGRLARHMRHYLGLLGLECSGWSRNSASIFNSHHQADPGARLRRTLQQATHVLLLVSDDAIPALVRQYPFLHGYTLVHCAGALSLPGIAGAHPLMSFSQEMYSLEQYREIPFLVEDSFEFSDIFPGLENPCHKVRVEQKALYHALCVMAGNFPQVLWRSVTSRFEQQLDLPGCALEPYLQRVMDNFLKDPSGALTGPLARGDQNTVARNQAALADDPLAPLYQAFVDLHFNERKEQEMPVALKERSS